MARDAGSIRLVTTVVGIDDYVHRLAELVGGELATLARNPLVGYEAVAIDAENCANYYVVDERDGG